MWFTAKLSVILRKRSERLKQHNNIHVEQDNATNELAMEQNEAYAAAINPQNKELEFEQLDDEAQSSIDTAIKMERNTAYQTVSCPLKENDYETITSS